MTLWTFGCFQVGCVFRGVPLGGPLGVPLPWNGKNGLLGRLFTGLASIFLERGYKQGVGGDFAAMFTFFIGSMDHANGDRWGAYHGFKVEVGLWTMFCGIVIFAICAYFATSCGVATI